jgi:hypothetical protein
LQNAGKPGQNKMPANPAKVTEKQRAVAAFGSGKPIV